MYSVRATPYYNAAEQSIGQLAADQRYWQAQPAQSFLSF